jgi:hypothetical protein
MQNVPVLAMFFVFGVHSTGYAQTALSSDAGAYGAVSATIGCDRTANGLVVAFADQEFRARVRVENGTEIEQGAPCLATLALFPPPFPALAGSIVPPNSGSDGDVNGSDYLLWQDQSGGYIVGCQPDGAGGLATQFVATDGMADYSRIGEGCGVSTAELSIAGSKLSGPYPINLGFDSYTGLQSGGLAWTQSGASGTEYIECNLNDSLDQLVVTYRETSIDGIDDTVLGQSCLAILSVGVAQGREFRSLPVQKDQAGCLIFDFENGGIRARASD